MCNFCSAADGLGNVAAASSGRGPGALAYKSLLNSYDARHNEGRDVGTPVVVTYSFADPDDFPGRNSGYRPVKKFGVFSRQDRDNIRDALAEFEKRAGITFIETPDDGKLSFMVAYGADGYSWAQYPVSSGTQDVVINREIVNSDIDRSGLGYQIVLHEIGHAMGLKHPFDGRPRLPNAYDNYDYTVMSYTYGTHHVGKLAPLDIDALRYYYGRAQNYPFEIDGVTNSGALKLSDGGRSHKIAFKGYALDADAGGGKDTLIGNDEGDTLDGGAGNDRIVGNDGDDSLLGSRGDDDLLGGRGDDVVRGGQGRDRAEGDRGGDRLFGDGGNDSLDGGRDNDTIDGGKGSDLLRGGSSGDSLKGAAGLDTIFGDAGNDTIIGGGGGDSIDGGQGDDLIFGEAGLDTIYGGAGQDTIEGGRGRDNLDGGAQDDLIRGDSDADTASGGKGADRVYGGNGGDSLSGGRGNDFLWGERNADWLGGGDGNDALFGGGAADTLEGNLGSDTLEGGDGADQLYGGWDNDILRSGSDRFGGMLDGGLHDDSLYAGTHTGASDTIVYRSNYGRDEVFGFSANDFLAIDVIGFRNADLVALAKTVNGDDVRFAFGDDNRLTLHDVDIAIITDSIFV